MGGFVRAKSKRATNPLDEDAKARLIGTAAAVAVRAVRSAGQNQRHRHLFSYISSGSEHDGDSAADDSPCLSKLVHGFLHEDDEEVKDSRSFFTYDSDSDVERVDSVNDRMESIEESVREALLARGADSFRDVLSLHVLRAVEAFSCLKHNKPLMRRKVMSSLREIGYNAAICKTRWDSSGGGLTAGNYEFIDVVQSLPSATPQQQQQEQPRLYVIDLEFAGEFEIARPTAQYSKLLGFLPRVFVARNDDLKKIVRAMCDAAKRSLKSRGLSLPPWRKSRYMINKWLGPYRRTVNPLPETTPISAVKCRTVGFEECLNGPIAVVRTR